MGGTTSKQVFSKLITSLTEKDIDANDHEFWDELWKLVLSLDDIFSVLTVSNIRLILKNHPENIKILFTQGIAQLYQIIETPYPIYFQQALNCMKILIRIMPSLLESNSKFVKELLWSRRIIKSNKEEVEDTVNTSNSATKEVIKSDRNFFSFVSSSSTSTSSAELTEKKDQDKESHPPSPTASSLEDSLSYYQESEPLAVILINTLYHLMFLPDFTVEDPDTDFSETDIDTPAFKEALMWYPGIGILRHLANSSNNKTKPSSPSAVASSTSTSPTYTSFSSPSLNFAPPPPNNTPSSFDSNRLDILLLMISSFSDSLFLPADLYDSCNSMWLEVATSADAPYAEIVFFSLINTIFGYDPNSNSNWFNLFSSPTPSSSSSAASSTSATTNPQNMKHLVELAVQVLIILLDYGHPIKYDSSTSGTSSSHFSSTSSSGPTCLPYVLPGNTQAQGFNIFRKLLGEISDRNEFLFLFKGFSRLLNFIYQQEISLSSSLFSSSTSQLNSPHNPSTFAKLGIEQELLLLLWKCLEEIPNFMTFILQNFDINELIIPINYLMLMHKRNPSRLGMIFLCSFILLKLSGERNFGVALNKPFVPVNYSTFRLPFFGGGGGTAPPPPPKNSQEGGSTTPSSPVSTTSVSNSILSNIADLPQFTGTHADFLIIIFHKVIVTGSERLASLYSCFLTIICNFSPYCKSLSPLASLKLVNLLQLFLSPRFLYAAKGNHVYVGLLLETLNNLIQYQYEGNTNLIYAIIRRSELFENLANLTLSKAISIAKEVSLSLNNAYNQNTGVQKNKSPTLTSNSAPTSPPEIEGDSPIGTQTSHQNQPGTKEVPNEYSSEDEEEDDHIKDENESQLESAEEGENSEILTKNEGEEEDKKLDKKIKKKKNKISQKHLLIQPTEVIGTRSVQRNDQNNEDIATDIPLSSSSTTTSSSVTSSSGPTTGPPLRFLPNEHWLSLVKSEVPLNTIMRLLNDLLPRIDQLFFLRSGSQGKKQINVEEKVILSFLKSTTMVGILPVPHPIIIRKYQPNKFTCLWFTAFQWGAIFSHNLYLPLFDTDSVKIFTIQNHHYPSNYL